MRCEKCFEEPCMCLHEEYDRIGRKLGKKFPHQNVPSWSDFKVLHRKMNEVSELIPGFCTFYYSPKSLAYGVLKQHIYELMKKTEEIYNKMKAAENGK